MKFSNVKLNLKNCILKHLQGEKNYINSKYNVAVWGSGMATECSATLLALHWE